MELSAIRSADSASLEDTKPHQACTPPPQWSRQRTACFVCNLVQALKLPIHAWFLLALVSVVSFITGATFVIHKPILHNPKSLQIMHVSPERRTLLGNCLDMENIAKAFFPFDRVSWPLQTKLKLQLASYATSCGGTQIALATGQRGTPDAARVIFYGSVVDTLDHVCQANESSVASQRFLMFYVGIMGPVAAGAGGHVCIAWSDDGARWEKPRLGQDGNIAVAEENNVGAVLVLYDPQDTDASRRFKMILKLRPYVLAVAFSHDGLRWPRKATHLEGLKGVDPSGLALWNGAYLLAAHRDRSFGKRKLHVFVSYDFHTWSEASGIFSRSVEQTDLQDNNAGEQVHLGAALWPRWPLLLGVYGQWHGHPSNDRSLVSIDLGLVVSSDGFNFEEPVPNFRFVQAAEDGCDSSWTADFPSRFPALVQGQAFANVGNRSLFWYGAWPEQRGLGIRVASWPRDRFGSWSCLSCNMCHAISVPMVATSLMSPEQHGDIPPRLHANVVGVAKGSAELMVELLDTKFYPIPKFSGSDAAVVHTAGFATPIVWKQKSAVHERRLVLPSHVRIKVSFVGPQCELARLFAVYSHPPEM